MNIEVVGKLVAELLADKTRKKRFQLRVDRI